MLNYQRLTIILVCRLRQQQGMRPQVLYYSITRVRLPKILSEWKLIALLGVGRWYPASRERRRDLDHEEDKASQSTSSQQE